jgi:hypothetical protein
MTFIDQPYTYDLKASYWLADDGRLFGSAPQALVTSADPDYVAWCSNHAAILWPRDDGGAQTDATLQAVLAPFGIFVNLNYYAANCRYNLASGGVTIAGNKYLSDPTARNTVSSAHDYAVANPGHITDWKLANGTFIKLTEAQLAHVLQEMATFVQACFTCESNQVAGIAGGTVTTRAQIDAAFAAIPTTYP